MFAVHFGPCTRLWPLYKIDIKFSDIEGNLPVIPRAHGNLFLPLFFPSRSAARDPPNPRSVCQSASVKVSVLTK